MATTVGCHLPASTPALPARHEFARDQLNFHSDVRLSAQHRLVEELVGGRRDLSQNLLLPTSDEPIEIYLFEKREDFDALVGARFPEFPGRRAIFVRTDASLTVLAAWSEHIGEDLRHEVTHAYLHSVVPNLPLWMDEGLAEYFEVGRGRHGAHRMHIARLVEAARADGWRPDLRRLEQRVDAEDLSPLEYAESWLWVHFLIESGPDRLELIQNQLARLRMSAEAAPMSEQIDKYLPDATNQVMDHLRQWEAQMADQRRDTTLVR